MYNVTISVTSVYTQIFTSPLSGTYSLTITEAEDGFNTGVVNFQEHGVANNIQIENIDMRGFLRFPRFVPTSFSFNSNRTYEIDKIGLYYYVRIVAGTQPLLVNFIANY